jgi:hypothetical protein
MYICEWAGSGSGRFISDVPFREVLRSLDVTAVITINYLKMAQNYNIGKGRFREEKLLDRLKNTTQYYSIILRPIN